MSKNTKIIIGTSIALGICGCAVGFVILGMSGLSLASLPLGIADCGWDTTASAWIDDNKNSVWDRDEKPLAEVQFIADDIQHDYDTSNEAISDINGKAWVSVFPVDCDGFDEIEIVVRAIPPMGYQPTTLSEISVPKGLVKNSENFDPLFGFVYEDQ